LGSNKTLVGIGNAAFFNRIGIQADDETLPEVDRKVRHVWVRMC